VTLQVTQAAGITLAVSSASVSVQSLATATVTVTATHKVERKCRPGRRDRLSALLQGCQRVYSIVEFADHQLRRRGDVDADLAGSSSAVAGSSTLNLSASIAAANGSTYKASTTLPMAVTLTLQR